MSYYRILSIDGGGIRGLITAILLERLEQAHPGFLAQVNLFAGTSTGGILALGLASGLSPSEGKNLYEQKGSEVFADSLIDDLRDLGPLLSSEYEIEPLKHVLEEQFGEKTLGDLNRSVLVSTFDLEADSAVPLRKAWKPKFFHNLPGDDSDTLEKVVDVAVRTSAAPTYFPIYQGYIDGGVVAGNPSMCALAQALHPETGGHAQEDVILFSLGTGHNPHFLTAQDEKWGFIQWAPHIISLVFEGGVGLVDYQCRQILGSRYFRLDPVLLDSIAMDDYRRIATMKRVAYQQDISEAIIWLEQYFE